MNLTENTKVRIRVPKHLYESIQAELAKQDHKKEETMEEGEDLNELDPKFQGAMDVLSSIPGIDKIAQIDPFFAGITLVGMLVGGLIAAPKIEQAIKALMAKIKDPKKKEKLAAAAEKSGINIEAGETVQEVEELEEVFDLDFGSLMEAMKDASKKKADEKKKKEAKIAADKKKAAATKKK